MHARTRLSPAEWQARLDECMRTVLAAPECFPPATLVWARWRRAWLDQHETPFRFHGEGTKNPYNISAETAARAKFSHRAPCLNAAGRRGGDE